MIGFYELSKRYEKYRFKIYSLEKKFGLLIIQMQRKAVLNTDLYCITAEQYSEGRNNIEIVKILLDNGIKVIQYREKEKTMLEKYQECTVIRELTYMVEASLIINDDIAMAIELKADDVHIIGQEDLPIEAVRSLIGDRMLIGVSTHSPEQAEDAVLRGADYIGVGPLFRTFTKKKCM